MIIYLLFSDDYKGVNELHTTDGKFVLILNFGLKFISSTILWFFFDNLRKGHKNFNQPFPEVFLTLGAPGENLMIPLSPRPGRPVSLNLNLIPKEDDKLAQCSSSPRKPRSRPSSPQPKAAQKAHPVNSGSPERGESATKDCFSPIENVHTSHLKMGATQGGQRHKGNPVRGRGIGKRRVKKDWKDGGYKH